MTSAVQDSGQEVPEIERRRERESYDELVTRLSVQSVRKHYDAYEDIAWDAPELQIDPHDPRFELGPTEGLGRTAWYRALPAAKRAEIGLYGMIGAMKIGVVFESVLKRGLRGPIAFATQGVVRLGRAFPPLFFFFVLGGEAPIDHAQKEALRSGRALHPLFRRIMQIHVTEEARHLCFARNYLERNVPKLGAFAKLRLRVAIPFILGRMAKMMLQPSRAMIRRFDIPADAIREGYTDNAEHKQRVRASLASVAKLCVQLELLRPREVWLWRLNGLGNPLRYAT